MSLDAAVWTVTVTLAGYQFTPSTWTISSSAGTHTHTFSMTANTITPPTHPNQITGVLVTLDAQGAPLPAVPISFQMTAGPGQSGYSPSSAIVVFTSDGSANLAATLEQGATYDAWRKVGDVVQVIVPTSGTSFLLPEILGGAT